MSVNTNIIGPRPVRVTPAIAREEKSLEKKLSHVQSLIQIYDPSKAQATSISYAISISPHRETSPLDSISHPSSSHSSNRSIGGEKPLTSRKKIAEDIQLIEPFEIVDPKLIELLERVDAIKDHIFEEKDAKKGNIPSSVLHSILLLERAVDAFYQVPQLEHQEEQASITQLEEVKPVFDETKMRTLEIQKILEEVLCLKDGGLLSADNQKIIQKISPQTAPLFIEINTLQRKHQFLFKQVREAARPSSSQDRDIDQRKENHDKISNDYEYLRRVFKILSIYKKSLLTICERVKLLDLGAEPPKKRLLRKIHSSISKNANTLSKSYNKTFEEIAKGELNVVADFITNIIQDQVDRRLVEIQNDLVENIQKEDLKPKRYEDLNEKLRVDLVETRMKNFSDIDRAFGNSIVFLEGQRLNYDTPGKSFQYLFNHLSLYFFSNPGVFYFLIENLANSANPMADKREEAYKKLMSLSKPEKKHLKEIFDEKFNSDKENIVLDHALTYLKISYNALQQGVLYFVGATLLSIRQTKFNTESLGCISPRLETEDTKDIKNEIHISLKEGGRVEFHYLRKDGLLIADAILHQEYTFCVGLPNSTQIFSPRIQAKLSFSCPKTAYDSNPKLQDMVFDIGIIAKSLGLGELKIQLT